MEITVLQETEQPVFDRTRLQLEITFEHAVPARGIIAEQLAQKQDVPLDTVAIRMIRSRFGGGTAQAEAFVYKSADVLAKFEQKHIVERTNKTLTQASEAPAQEAEPKAEEPAAKEPAADEPAEEPEASEKKE